MDEHRRAALGWIAASVVGTVCCFAPRRAYTESPLLVVRNPVLGTDRGEIRFTRGDLEALEWHEITTTNQFIDGAGRFRGPRVADAISLIGHAGAAKVRLVSAGGSFTEIDIRELGRYEAILALEMDGRPLTLRDFGPIWVMYPIDDHSELRDSRFNNRLVWQLQVIELF